jgi:hypothetical protein
MTVVFNAIGCVSDAAQWLPQIRIWEQRERIALPMNVDLLALLRAT